MVARSNGPRHRLRSSRCNARLCHCAGESVLPSRTSYAPALLCAAPAEVAESAHQPPVKRSKRKGKRMCAKRKLKASQIKWLALLPQRKRLKLYNARRRRRRRGGSRCAHAHSLALVHSLVRVQLLSWGRTWWLAASSICHRAWQIDARGLADRYARRPVSNGTRPSELATALPARRSYLELTFAGWRGTLRWIAHRRTSARVATGASGVREARRRSGRWSGDRMLQHAHTRTTLSPALSRGCTALHTGPHKSPLNRPRTQLLQRARPEKNSCASISQLGRCSGQTADLRTRSHLCAAVKSSSRAY